MPCSRSPNSSRPASPRRSDAAQRAARRRRQTGGVDRRRDRTANTILDGIDPTLRPTLWKADDDQPMLPDDAALTVLRCNSIDRVALPTKHDGWTLAVDDGIDDTKPSLFGGCKTSSAPSRSRAGAKLRLRIGTSDLDGDRARHVEHARGAVDLDQADGAGEGCGRWRAEAR